MSDLLTAPEWDALDASRLPLILEAMIAEHPEPDKLRVCKPGINLREVEGDRLQAYMVDQHGLDYIIGFFPRSMLLRRDVAHPAANN